MAKFPAQCSREFLAKNREVQWPIRDTLGQIRAKERATFNAHDPLQAGASAVFRTIAAVDQLTYREDGHW
jgi:hypothetical protein